MSYDNGGHGAGRVSALCFWRSRYGLGLAVIGAVAGYFLLTEHLAHVVGILPFLLLLVCPLMHVFMHRDGHHVTDRSAGKAGQSKPGEPS